MEETLESLRNRSIAAVQVACIEKKVQQATNRNMLKYMRFACWAADVIRKELNGVEVDHLASKKIWLAEFDAIIERERKEVMQNLEDAVEKQKPPPKENPEEAVAT